MFSFTIPNSDLIVKSDFVNPGTAISNLYSLPVSLILTDGVYPSKILENISPAKIVFSVLFIILFFICHTVQIQLSDKLFNKLIELKKEITEIEDSEITISELVEEALLGHFNVKLSSLNSNIKDVKKEFYIYCIYDLNKPIIKLVNGILFEYEPLYIGRNNEKTNIINQFKNRNTVEKIIIDNLNENESYQIQQIFINNFGRLNNGTGCLYNKTEGKKILSNKDVNNDKHIILRSLNQNKTIKSTAEALNISRRTLHRKIKKYTLELNFLTNKWEIKKN